MVAIRFYLANDAAPDIQLPNFSTLPNGAFGKQFAPLYVSKHVGHANDTGRQNINAPGPNTSVQVVDVSEPAVLPVGVLSGNWCYVFRSDFYAVAGAQPYIRMLVCSGDGLTLRGILFAGTVMSLPSGNRISKLEGTLSPVTVQAGDRFVIERGTYFASVGAYNSLATFYDNHDAALPDLTLAQVGTTGAVAQLGASWIELTPDVPAQVPTNVAVVPGSTDLAITWAPPAAGPVPMGYEVRVDGGAPVAVLGLAYEAGGLTPQTNYVVEVRAVAPGGPSAWVSVLATTLLGADYRVVVRLGDQTWDVLAGDPPEFGPTLPVSFGWAVPEDSLGFPAQPAPDVCNLEVVTQDHAPMTGVDIATTMRVSIYNSPAPSARPVATFRGRVADLEASPHPMGLLWRVLGVGYTADAGTRQVGTGAWPQESGDDRMARIVTEAGFPGWAADPVGSTFEAREPGATFARAELEDAAASAVSNDGTVYGPSRRVLVHPLTDADGNPLPLSPFAGTQVLARTDAIDFLSAGLVNRATTWRRTKLLDASWVKIDHPGGPTVYGDPRGPAYPPQSVAVLDPSELADMILDTTPGFRWLTGQPLRLELWADGEDKATMAIVSQWFYRDPASHPFPWSGRSVVVQGIVRTPDGADSYAGMLAAATMRLEHTAVGGRLVVEFRLRPEIPAHSTVTVRWMDEDPAKTWAQEPDPNYYGVDWYTLRTTPR